MIKLEVTFDANKLGITNVNDKDEVDNADYYTLI